MRIPSNQYQAVMKFALKELEEIYPVEEIKSLIYWLFEEYLEVDRTQYLLNPLRGMSESELLKFNFAIKDLKKGKPIQYILGHTYFLDLKLLVNEHTLIPRPETEELVLWVEEYLKNKEKESHPTTPLKILDMCTGTGCIPLALSNSHPQNQYFGADFKEEILQLAKNNAEHNKLDVQFFKYDLLKDFPENQMEFDIIISNPPYVLESDKSQMHQNVLNYEPHSALYVDDNEALLFYNKILEYAIPNLKLGGWIFFEIHENKTEHIEELFSSFQYSNFEYKIDFRGKNRFAKAQK
jgi:release factor glutamine methyltransferase